MKFTVIMRDPVAGDDKLEIVGSTNFRHFLNHLTNDLNHFDADSAFTITIEKDQPACLIQLVN